MGNKKKWYFRDWLYKHHMKLVTKPLSVKATSNKLCDRHIFILLLRRIRIEMPHAKRNNNKKQQQQQKHRRMQTITADRGRTINHESIYNLFVFFAIRINCRLMTSVSWSGNQTFLLLRLQIAKWHTSYPAWWGSAWGQHAWNRKHRYGYDGSRHAMFSRSHRRI